MKVFKMCISCSQIFETEKETQRFCDCVCSHNYSHWRYTQRKKRLKMFQNLEYIL
jgi:hypothetical protein